MTRQRSWWGWGWADEALDDGACLALGAGLAEYWPGFTPELRPVPAPPALPRPRIRAPETLADLFRDDDLDRAAHTYGNAYRDVVRALAGRFDHPPDLVARPRDESDVVAVLDWAASAGVAVIPYGGGTSVVGGVEYRGGDHPGVVSLDLTGLGQVLEVDEVSQAARIQAGALGPGLEAQLRLYGLTLRHYPQSFEFSTLGGWLATRAGGHFATGYTHIDDYVESLRVVTPAGVAASRRLPASGAGPSPDRLFLGSEGTLGVITEAWMRVQRRPVHRAGTAVAFASFAGAVTATREIVQAGLRPANCRLLDPAEARLQAGVDDGGSRLLLAFESPSAPVDAELATAVGICRDHGGSAGDGDTGGAWRSAFLRAPYLRDALARVGVVAETFETACTWDRFDALHAAVLAVVPAASCRFTHVYPDGPAPYYTVMAPGGVDTWDALKAQVSTAILAQGGTITHHHAVGRDHRPWYDRQRPDVFALALRAAKRALDPAGILNPGALI